MTEALAAQPGPMDITGLRTVLNFVACGVVLYEPSYDEQQGITDFRLLTLNEEAERITGQSVADAAGRMAHELWPEGWQTNLWECAVRVVETGVEQQTSAWLTNRCTGFRTFYQVLVRPAFQGIAISLTEATFLAPEHELLATIVDHSPNGIAVYRAVRDSNGQIVNFRTVRYNQKVLELCGFSPADMEEKTMLERFPAVQDYLPRYRALIDEGAPFVGEHYFEKTGRWVENQARKLGDGYFSMLRDVTEQRRAIEDLTAQQHLLQTILDTVEAGVMLYSPVYDDTNQLIDFRYELANQTMATYAGVSAHELVGTRVNEWFPSYYDNGNFAVYRRAYESGQPEQFDQHYADDGLDVWLTVNANRLGDKLLVTFTDFTPIKRAEQQLKATLDASINSILAMTAIRDGRGEIIDFSMDMANGSVERSLGRKPQELEGHTLLELYPGNIENGFFDLYAKATDTGVPQQGTLHYTDSNGFEGWFEVSAVRQSENKVVITFMNVTQQKQNELKVREQAELVESVLNATLTAVAVYEPVRAIDADGQPGPIVDFRFTLANQASVDTLGLLPEVLYTKTLCDMNPVLRNSPALARYVEVAETGVPVTLERQVGDRWFLVSAVRFGEDGLLTSSIDVTEIKQAKEQIEQMNAQLKRSNESLDQFAAIASHDLQEPLRKIEAFGSLLLDRYGPALGEGVTLLERMQSAARRMSSLIRDLLTYSRLSKTGALARKPVNLSPIVTEVLVDLELAITDKGAVVEVEPLPTLLGDELQLRQVFQNLLANALKFTQPGRSPRITVRAERLDAQQLPTDIPLPDRSRPYHVLTVADNGIGFNDEYRERIFGAFERLHGKGSPYSGSGIGLTIVHKVMENHEGIVSARGVPGEGAVFQLYFPIG
ncbi:PAS domain-containing sensor histidine kinase [Larkinella sp. VNQ87]|uniref:PAS domain-containing sensor histidine kinase n=1 Tax=Larkinella sp. VNQ87 TaxID=3400921 RepID=UPI003C028579